MRIQPCSHTFLAFILKFLNFLQLFIGLSMIMYSAYMLNHWNNNDHSHDDQPPHPPPSPSATPPYGPDAPSPGYDHVDLAAVYLSAFNHGIQILPAPWFIFAFMGLGIALCCVTCIGHIAAEAINGCCLCFYTFLSAVLISIEATFVAFVTFDHHWEKDLPFDPTGELDHLREFIEENVEICAWVGITVLIIQALSLLISLLLRALVSVRNSNYDIEDDYDSSRQPLLNPQLNQASGSIKVDGQLPKSDTWSSRMRKKIQILGSENIKLTPNYLDVVRGRGIEYGLDGSSSSHNLLH